MNQDNVIQIPDKVTRVVRRIKDALAKMDHGREQLVEGAIELCAAVAEARANTRITRHSVLVGQARLCRADGELLNSDDRAACIAMGGHLKC